MKKVAILGASGSIGLQAVDVIQHHKEEFELFAFSVYSQVDKAIDIVKELKVKHVCLKDELDVEKMRKRFPDIIYHFGDEGIFEIVSLVEVDIVINSIVGFAGVLPSIKAIQARKDLALANKETLVVAGEIVTNYVKEYGVKLLPVDSEHSAIFQCLNGEQKSQIKRVIITASGGSFRDKTREELKDVSVEDALKHPNWSMGANITIDSATMFNKGLEVIEARWLFDLDYEQIDVIMHPESVIHSMVEFVDGSVMAQMASPDMRLAIQYALTYPNRLAIASSESLDLLKYKNLTFREVDFNRFPALKLAYQVGKIGGSLPATLNGAKEAATALFLKKEIEFIDIDGLVEDAIASHTLIKDPNYQDLELADQWAREFVIQKVGEKKHGNIN